MFPLLVPLTVVVDRLKEAWPPFLGLLVATDHDHSPLRDHVAGAGFRHLLMRSRLYAAPTR